jgi:hypothetical protein
MEKALAGSNQPGEIANSPHIGTNRANCNRAVPTYRPGPRKGWLSGRQAPKFTAPSALARPPMAERRLRSRPTKRSTQSRSTHLARRRARGPHADHAATRRRSDDSATPRLGAPRRPLLGLPVEAGIAATLRSPLVQIDRRPRPTIRAGRPPSQQIRNGSIAGLCP